MHYHQWAGRQHSPSPWQRYGLDREIEEVKVVSLVLAKTNNYGEEEEEIIIYHQSNS